MKSANSSQSGAHNHSIGELMAGIESKLGLLAKDDF